MLTQSFFIIVNRSSRGRRAVFRLLFEYLSKRFGDLHECTQMNYGYAGMRGNGDTLSLDKRDAAERYCRQLYAHVASGLELSGRDVVEVSSGRGGGAAFLYRYLGLGTMTGVDIAGSAIAFCRRNHEGRNLRFLQGDAEDLPLFDESADAVINIEASFCYGDIARFLSEASRILRPGGHLLYADLRLAEEVPTLRKAFLDSGFSILDEEDISHNVVRALMLDSERRDNAGAMVPFPLRYALRTFAGALGTRIPTLLANKKMCYLRFRLQKPPAFQRQPDYNIEIPARFGHAQLSMGREPKAHIPAKETRKLENIL